MALLGVGGWFAWKAPDVQVADVVGTWQEDGFEVPNWAKRDPTVLTVRSDGTFTLTAGTGPTGQSPGIPMKIICQGIVVPDGDAFNLTPTTPTAPTTPTTPTAFTFPPGGVCPPIRAKLVNDARGIEIPGGSEKPATYLARQ